MPDPRFYSTAGPFTLHEVARIAGAEAAADASPTARYRDVAPLDQAGPDDVAFFEDRRQLERFLATRAGACLVRSEFADRAPDGVSVLLTPRPQAAYALLAQAFYPSAAGEAGAHPSALIDGTATVGAGCRIATGCVVGPGAEIGDHCELGAHVVIGRGVRLGAGSKVGVGVSLMYCLIGERAIIHPGVRIGQDGFGYVTGPEGHRKVPQLGRVVIGDDVEIGANTTIDRGAMADTVIGSGTKIDNLVQIGHNVRLGRGCVVVAQVGISGSTTVGDFVMIGGQAGLSGHLNIGSGARIGAQSGVMNDVAPGTTVFGYPAGPYRQYMRQLAELAKLTKKTRK